MAAYAALVPLGMSLQRLLYSSQLSLLPPTQEMIETAYAEIKSFTEVIKTFDGSERSSRCYERAKALDRRIREAVCRVEDMLEPHLSTQYFSQSEETLASDPNCPSKFTIDLDEVKQEINSFIATLVKIKGDYVNSLKLDEKDMSFESNIQMSEDLLDYQWNQVLQGCEIMPEEDDKEIKYSEEDWLSTGNYEMVGLADKFIELRSSLIRGPCSIQIITIGGMAGIGKTAIAKQLYVDPMISNHFKCRAFVSVGPRYELKQVVTDILSQLQNHLDIVNIQSASTNILIQYVLRTIGCRRCLVVLDDIWSSDLIFHLHLNLIVGCGSRVLLTTRIEHVATDFKEFGDHFRMRFLNEEESWFLLCQKVFGKDSWCPFDLRKFGKRIAENCDGLPLAIIAVSDLLAQGNMTVDYWKKVSEDSNPLSIGTNDQHPMMDVLHVSYDRLSQLLKTSFLYMGVFPQRHEIVASKLIRLWIAERFVDYLTEEFSSMGELDYLNKESSYTRELERMGMEYLGELSSQNVVLVIELSSGGRIKTCKLHSVFWHVCVSEAKKENLFHIIDKYSSSFLAEDIKDYRRLCVHNNAIFGIKDAYNSMACISNARSLLCTGPQHDYPVPMCFEIRLLRVLDTLTIRFYEFPIEAIKLVQLRYLAFTYNGMIHASISQLWNLHFLIVQHHLSIVSHEAPLYLPVEIWNMKELMHLQVAGALLPQPHANAILPKLSTILDLSAQCLTTAVVNSIPNVTKLGIQIDSSTQDPFCFFDHLCHLHKLESLKCVIVNPKPKSQVVAPPAPKLKIFPLGLKKLSLSGFGYPWTYMRGLGELRNLEVLKLRKYAFQGPEWVTNPWHFPNLKVLLLEDLDLMDWMIFKGSLCFLVRLIIRHCYKLNEIPSELGLQSSSSLKEIELVEVKRSVVDSAKRVLQLQSERVYERIQLHVDCSWEDRN